MAATEDDIKMLHIVMLPWLAFGHLLPFFHLANYLASKGHQISFLSAPPNLHRLPKIPDHGLPISLVPLPLPPVAGLPPTAAATTDVSSDKIPLLRKAYRDLQGHVARFLEGCSHVDWIIHDLNPWIGPIADSLGIKKAFFITTNAWTISVLVAPLPSLDCFCLGGHVDRNLVCRLREARRSLGDTEEVSEETAESIKNTDVILIRGCVELQAESLQLLKMLHKKPVVPAGLMPASSQHHDDLEDHTWQVIRGWLDKQKERSVVYVALGSEVSPSQDQMSELALGLELSELPFLWVLRRPEGSSVDTPEGFEERSRGLVWRKWAPQSRILGHDSVGGFLTHCGCSSVVEGLEYGRPLIMLPFVLDQVLNARILQEKKIGVEIVKDEQDGSIDRRTVAELVRLVVEDEAGGVFRDEAAKVSGIVGDIGLQTQYFERLEEYLRNNNGPAAHLPILHKN